MSHNRDGNICPRMFIACVAGTTILSSMFSKLVETL
jgi:hypothetical protein